MKKNLLIALPLAATLILPAAAQTSTQNSNDQQSGQISTGISNQPTNDPQAGSSSKDNLGPHQPLQPDTHEGFWGHLNPFARKKYVQRQMSPIRDRVNELDELTASNTRMLKDVDARATEGIRVASTKANEADQKAVLAGQHAQEANQTAQQASTRLQSVEQVVGNIDQYKSAGTAEVKFRAGQTTLSKSAKEEIDQMVANLANQRGYVIQVQGFSPGRGQAAIQSSQTMAQAVARYLVIEHQVPVYRIFVVGMGNAPIQGENGEAKKVRGGRVEVSVLKNGLDQLQQTASASAPSEGGVAGAASTSSAPAANGAAPASAAGNQAPWQQKSNTTQSAPQQDQQQNQQPK